MNHLRVFERLYEILIETARARRTITDREIMARLGWNDHDRTRAMFLDFELRSIGTIQQRIGTLPLLTAVVVAETTGRPLPVFFEEASAHRRLTGGEDEESFWLGELAQVYSFWRS